MSNAEAWFNVALRPQKAESSLGRGAQDGHHDFHTAPDGNLMAFVFELTRLLQDPDDSKQVG